VLGCAERKGFFLLKQMFELKEMFEKVEFLDWMKIFGKI
jgi:hypothetical protein